MRSPPRGGAGGGRYAEMSPDRRRTVFIRDWNLWVRDVATGRETQLTRDGVKDFGYATDNAGWARSDRPIVRWSPDSKKIATFQQDQRGVGEMYLVDTTVGHPALQAWKYPLPGDATVTMIQRVDHRRRRREDCPPSTPTRSAPFDALRRPGVPRRLGRRAVEPRRFHRRVRVDGARSPARTDARRRCDDRRHQRRPRGEGRDVLRVGQRRGQLALPAGVQRGHLVFGARQLGPSLPARSEDGPREAPDHHRQRQRHAAASR